ncbi:EcsC family protein [Curtobacterium sp. VKM Ac-1376]|uniref:EcsC family protein n=1 Tax=Curtobacterium sp. VKM Ac-1376 TaxID=123312 RepID=UPI001889DC17|nr:EcsC family protein [Curtobacterium sp. VKM Ac-1376]MBF4615839.1 EcsC family protein [Curtobacterium sp. VKM Ac-1376]
MSEVVIHDRRMSAYEERVWAGLDAYWHKRNNARGLPNWASTAIERGGTAVQKGAGRVVEAVPERIKDPIRSASNAVADAAIRPALESAVALLNLANDWVLELNDPATVEKLARKRGLDVEVFTDLRRRDIRDCDRLLTGNTLRWRSAGAVEGGAMGALALVPIAGIPLALTADIVVVQALSASIAARVAYSYGYDAKDPEEQEFIQRIVRRSFFAQAAKAGPIRDASRAAWAAKDRVRWSNKLRTDHRLLAALEKLMKHAGVSGGRVSVQSVAKVAPFVGIVIGAGVNAAVLGQLAEDAKRYCQTRFLSEKYGLPMPTALLHDDDEEASEDVV